MDAHHHGNLPGLAAPELAHHLVVDLAPLGAAAARAVMTATHEKAFDAANVEGPDETETNHLNFEQYADDGKRFATLRALLALNGHSLYELADSSYLSSKWNCTKHLPDLHAVQRFARQVGADV